MVPVHFCTYSNYIFIALSNIHELDTVVFLVASSVASPVNSSAAFVSLFLIIIVPKIRFRQFHFSIQLATRTQLLT